MARFSLRNLFLGNSTQGNAQPSVDTTPKKLAAAIGLETETLRAYDNSNITFKSDLSDIDFDAILRDK